MTAVAVLGPLVLAGPEGAAIRLASARQRRLLAALVAHLGQAVRTELLADMIWDGRAEPDDPRGAVQTNVARLRRLLPPGVRIQTVPGGYRLLADRATVDVAAFADHVDAAAAAGDARLRLHHLDAALALWRGRPFTELDHPELEPEIARLTALHAVAAEQHAAALLESGRVPESLAALEALTVAEPLREGAVALLMRALVAAGRQSDALAAFGRLRARLAEELGLDPGPELRDLEQQVLRQELTVARPVAPVVRAAALRLPVSSFVGRERDLSAAADLLAHSRVVTLCGPGGVGKTRLATHLAAAVTDRYGDGALLVELGDGGPGDVEHALVAALRMAAGRGSGSMTDRIVDVLAVRTQLLVLDNCEHVAGAVAPLVEAITTRAPSVDLLLTSREPVRVDGEHVVQVEPLGPAAAAELLRDRIRAADRDGAVGRMDLVPQLCRRLDGLPLALELAAARAPALGLAGLLDALEQPLEVLRGGRRTAAARHRSLRDVVEWSVGLLDEGQRTLFEEMSVFAGPVERGAIADVCGRADALPDLVDRSLVRRHPAEPARFGMLETLRAFGRSRLVTDPAGTALRARHARWALHLAEEITQARQGPGEAAAVGRFDAHVADLRRAHSWLCANGPVDDLLRLSRIFGELGYLRGRIDLTRMVEEALSVAGVLGTGAAPLPGSAHPQAPRLLGLLATARWQHGDLDAAERYARHAIELAAACGDPNRAAAGHEALANVLSFRGDLAGAMEHSGRARELARAGGDPEIELLALVDLGLGCVYSGDDVGAARHESATAALAAELGSPSALAWSSYVRGERLAERGDPESAEHLAAAVRAAEQVDSAFVAGVARHTLLTSSARRSTDPAAALGAFGPLIDHWHSCGAWTQLWIAMRALAATLSRLGRHRDAAVLLGAAGASPLAPRPFGADEVREQEVARAAREALGTDFEVLLAEGAGLGDVPAVGLARRLTRSAGVAPASHADDLPARSVSRRTSTTS